MRIQNGGNVGIATTSPNALLQIDTPATNNAGQGLRLNRPSTGINYHSVEFATNGTVDWSVGQNSNDAFEVYENGAAVTTRFTIKEGGNIGIGTTSPNDKLHIVGNLFIEDSSPEITLETGATHYNWQIAAQENVDTALEFSVGSQDSDASNDTFTPKMVILQNGRVGIGTTSPGAKLDVNGNVYVRSGSALYLDTLAGYTSGVITLNASTNLIVPSGNVGIGTTSPNFRLGLSNSTALTAVYQQFTNGTTGTTSSDGTVMGIDADGDFLINNQEAKEIKLYTSDTQRLTVQSGGNVGIGTASPNTLLHIFDGAASNTATTDLLKLQAYTGDFGATPAAIALAFKFQDSNNSTNEARIRMATVNDTDYGDNDEAASNLIFSTTNGGVESDKMIITGRGNVGIGTTNPSDLLHLAGTTAQLFVENTASSGQAYIRFKARSDRDAGPFIKASARGGTATDSDLRFGDETGDIMTLNGGKVGIGTVSPAYELDVTGTGRFTSNLLVEGTLTETSAKRFKENIQPLESQLENIEKLNPVSFDWKKDGKSDIGLIAEEVKETIPTLVSEEDGEVKGIQYTKLTAILIKAVQEQQKQIDELKEEIFILKKK